MKERGKYSIAFQGLSIGVHQFEFECDSEFLNRHSEGMYPKGDCKIEIELEKGANLITINYSITGEVEVECDRCLDRFMMDVDYDGSIFIKFSQEIDEPAFDGNPDGESDILWMNPADNYIDLAQYIYESIILALPARRVHGEDENGVSLCDPSMLERFSVAPDDFDQMEDSDEDDSFEIGDKYEF
ncbi:MAG: DUF177 domain-containing protein [Rikenellaceae bacterium]